MLWDTDTKLQQKKENKNLLSFAKIKTRKM